jgi:oxygen-independent coproporphyrinogen-3 oxidase
MAIKHPDAGSSRKRSASKSEAAPSMPPAADSTLAERYAAPVPRYTSYPTAPHFTSAVGPDDAAAWMAALPENAALSLYLHIPFCRQLCWYCGCATTVVNRQEPVESYLASLEAELAEVAGRLPASHRATHIHWGGGSPNTLMPEEIIALASRTRALFNVENAAEFAVELDPRFMDAARVDAFAAAGVNRVSLGVQDFDEAVQCAINRCQPYEMTAGVVAMVRDAGIRSLNIDLVYGLPGQTTASVTRTIDQVLALEPDRIAVFGYAHLPERIRHQRLIETSHLPGPAERLAQSNRIAAKLLEAGYVRVGLDHFAKPTDTLASAPLHRNFQGYTTDDADALIGFGASAISRYPQGYAQNTARTPDYQRLIAERGLATVRGIALSDDDRIRSYVIEKLMCELAFSDSDLEARFGTSALRVIEDARRLCEQDTDGFIEKAPGGFRISERGRPFVRTVCASFDTYLERSTARHSAGV